MRTQMGNIWKYLDDLAESDPAKYYEFQRQQRQILDNEMKYQNDQNNTNCNQLQNSKRTQSNESPLEQYDFEKHLKSLKNSQTKNNTNYFNPIPKFCFKTRIEKVCQKLDNSDATQMANKRKLLTLENNNNGNVANEFGLGYDEKDYQIKENMKLFINVFESPYCRPLLNKSKNNNPIRTEDIKLNLIKLKDVAVPFESSKLAFEINDKNKNKNKNKDRNKNSNINTGGKEICLRVDAIFHESMFVFLNNFNVNHNPQQQQQQQQQENNSNNNLFEKWIVELVMRQIESNYSETTSVNWNNNNVSSFKISRNYKKLKNRKFFGKIAAKPQYIGEKKSSATKSKGKTAATTQKENSNTNPNGMGKEIEYKNSSDNDGHNSSSINGNSNVINSDGKQEKEQVSLLLREVPRHTTKIDLKKGKFKITIQLPKEKDFSDIDLDVSDTQLTLKSQIYSLKVPLSDDMIKIDPDIVKAKFDKEKHCLIVKLHLIQ